jgi:hypothetical protein
MTLTSSSKSTAAHGFPRKFDEIKKSSENSGDSVKSHGSRDSSDQFSELTSRSSGSDSSDSIRRRPRASSKLLEQGAQALSLLLKISTKLKKSAPSEDLTVSPWDSDSSKSEAPKHLALIAPSPIPAPLAIAAQPPTVFPAALSRGLQADYFSVLNQQIKTSIATNQITPVTVSEKDSEIEDEEAAEIENYLINNEPAFRPSMKTFGEMQKINEFRKQNTQPTVE